MLAGLPAGEPFFLEGGAGRLFCIHHRPAMGKPRGTLIYVPPFAEEMNRSRRMAALQARALAESGVGVLLLDLFGTGESDGDFADARWPVWLADIAAAADWLDARASGPVGLWGLRLGAMLAAEAAARQPDRFRRLVLWQPVTDGKAAMTQFLRIRVAAALGDGGERVETIRAELVRHRRPIEVAGYSLAGELVEAVDAARLGAIALPRSLRVDWLELTAASGDEVGVAAQRVIGGWRQAGVPVAMHAMPGDPFWALHDTTVVPDLVRATTRVAAS
jgi:exosortase A-associated hydrolase 2